MKKQTIKLWEYKIEKVKCSEKHCTNYMRPINVRVLLDINEKKNGDHFITLHFEGKGKAYVRDYDVRSVALHDNVDQIPMKDIDQDINIIFKPQDVIDINKRKHANKSLVAQAKVRGMVVCNPCVGLKKLES